jgi:eukaryotic-like serine/threonine-protein kinase
MKCSGCGSQLDSRATFCPNCGRTVEDPHIGVTIARRYQPEKRIAIGGFGSIYRASQLDKDRPVALKIMHRELAADENLVARFRREGEVLIKLRDRHTVATYELGQTPEGLPFIAMELLEGESLLRLFQLYGRMPWHRVFAVARAICRALGEAHALGIIHRDLKPGNIFVTTEGGVKVLDFGIAKIMATSDQPHPQELTRMGTAVGTVEYMAPEQLMGGKADARTDIYTLGVLAFEMITGRRPFNAAGLELLTVQLTESPPPPSSLAPVPPIVDEVLLRCLAADSGDRYRDVHDLSGALAAALATYEPPSRRMKAPSSLPFAAVNGPSNTVPPPIGRPASAPPVRAATTPPRAATTPPRAATTPPVATAPPRAPTAPRAATPLPSERPAVRADPTAKFARNEPPRGQSIMLGVAIILFFIGAGLFVAWML